MYYTYVNAHTFILELGERFQYLEPSVYQPGTDMKLVHVGKLQ